MSDVLSAEQIAELFAAAKDGSLPEGPRRQTRRSRSIRKVDFNRPMKLSLLEQKRFEQAHAAFCRDASVRLSGELRSPIELEVINSSQLTWQAALGEVPRPSMLGAVRCAPSEAMILMCLEEGLVLRMIERLLGGSFAGMPAPRALTQIDVLLARQIFDVLLGTLSNVWKELLGLELGLQEFDLQNTTLEYLAPSQPTLELVMELRDQSASSTMLLLVPYTAIETAPKGLGDSTLKHSDAGGPDGQDAEGVRSALGTVRVQVRAEAGAIGLTIGEVLSLSEGDVVRLGASGNAGIAIGENRLHHARPGLSGNRRAVQIIEPAQEGP